MHLRPSIHTRIKELLVMLLLWKLVINCEHNYLDLNLVDLLWFRIQYLNDLELMILHLIEWVLCFKLYNVFLHLIVYFLSISIPLKYSLIMHYEI